jgi:hypothetical protein
MASIEVKKSLIVHLISLFPINSQDTTWVSQRRSRKSLMLLAQFACKNNIQVVFKHKADPSGCAI